MRRLTLKRLDSSSSVPGAPCFAFHSGSSLRYDLQRRSFSEEVFEKIMIMKPRDFYRLANQFIENY